MERKSFKRSLTLLAFSMLLTMLLGISFPVRIQAASPGTWVRICHNGYAIRWKLADIPITITMSREAPFSRCASELPDRGDPGDPRF